MLLHKEDHLKYDFQSHQFHINARHLNRRKQSQPTNEISLNNFSNFLHFSRPKKLIFPDFPQKRFYKKQSCKMRCILPLSFATLLLFFCTVDRIIAGPIPDDGTNYEPVNSTQDHPSGDQPFPFREYQNESTNYVVVDDMVISKDPSRAGMIDANWPNGIVPYTFALTIAPNQRTQIMDAMKELTAVSCVKFRPMKKDDTYNIEFKNDPLGGGGCSSFVGWQNRKNQPIQLGSVCSKGNVIHEILHALGFFHEQTRDDRDDYVTINYQNIQPGFENNFKKDGDLYPNAETGYFGVPYNYDSIMHYGKTYFSRNGQNTIDVKDNPDVDNAPVGSPDNLGQRDFISEGDVTMLRSKYNCDVAEENESNPDENSPNPEEGEGQESETTEAATTAKPTTKSPMCQYNPGLPMCKQ